LASVRPRTSSRVPRGVAPSICQTRRERRLYNIDHFSFRDKRKFREPGCSRCVGDSKPGDAKPSAAGQGASPKSSDKAGEAKPSTSGQGAAGAPANLSTEQRTTIRTVIKQQNVQPVTNVTFAISIGTRVPRTVHFYPVFDELVQIYPSWRGYEFFLVGDQIIVVNPRTLEIVAVLDV
jgi:hypothetical protein